MEALPFFVETGRIALQICSLPHPHKFPPSFIKTPAPVGAHIVRPAERLYKFAFSFGEKVSFLPCWYRPARPGPKPLFLLQAKEKAVLDSEKEKKDQRKLL